MNTSTLKHKGYKKVFRFEEPKLDFTGFVALHSLKRGPAFGGTRYWEYSTEKEALADALRLARTMSYKAALANLDCGGGKGVIIAKPDADRPAVFQEYAEFVDSLKGEFFTGRDAGTTLEDIEVMREVTSHVVNESVEECGDLNEATALGVFHGMRACLAHAYPEETFLNRRIAIQGVGGVGLALAKMLRWAGARIIVSDLVPERMMRGAKEASAGVIEPGGILEVACDILAPCALGAVIDPDSVARLKCAIVCGSANNTLASDEIGAALMDRRILYAPDYVVNAGALIQGANYYLHKKQDNRAEIIAIYDTLLELLALAHERHEATNLIADRLAASRLK